VGNLNDFLHTVGDLNLDSTRKASDIVDTVLNLAGNGFGAAADISGAVGFVQFALSLIDTIQGKDVQLSDILNKMQDLFRELHEEQRAENTLARMRDLEQSIVPAESVLQSLKEIASQNPPLSKEFLVGQIEQCVGALVALTDLAGTDNKWRAVYGDQIFYDDGWSGKVAPNADGDGLVFNYTYIAPLYLRTIYILLTAIAALLPKDLKNYAGTLSNCIQRLQMVHDMIVNGIVSTRVPAPTEIWRAFDANYQQEWNIPNSGAPYFATTAPGPFLAYSVWSGGATGVDPNSAPSSWPFQLYGAVEIYSGISSVARYHPIDLPPSGPPPDEGWMSAVQSKLALRILKARKDVYAASGAADLLRTANNLRGLIGVPTLPESNLNYWKLNEIFGTLGWASYYGADWHNQPQESRLLHPTPTLRCLRRYLESVPPTKTGFFDGQTAPYAPASLRQMLQP
jgi:hypothetical protein